MRCAEAGTVHFGIGAALGVLFGLVSSRMPARNRVTQGVIFGLLVWLTAYKGWVPALNIMPPPEKDRKDRPIIMVLAHIVYGATLGWMIKRWGA